MIINNELLNTQKQGDKMYNIEMLSDKVIIGFRRSKYSLIRKHVEYVISSVFIHNDPEENWNEFLTYDAPIESMLTFDDYEAIKKIKEKINNEEFTFLEFLKELNDNVINFFSAYCELRQTYPSDSEKIKNKNFEWLNSLFSYRSYPTIKHLIKEYSEIKEIPLSEEEINENKEEKVDETIIDGSNFDNINEDSFLDPENVKDPTGKTVEDNDYSVKITKKNARGEVLIESIIKNSLRSIIPVSNIATYGLTQFTGIDVFAPISKRPFISKHNGMSLKERFTTTNLDYNILYNVAPDALIVLSKLTNNRKMKLAASASPLLFQLLANFKERGNPIKFDPESNDIDFGQLLALCIPLVAEFVKPYMPIINTESFTNVIPQNVKSIWGIGGKGFGNAPQIGGRHELRRNITQPTSFN